MHPDVVLGITGTSQNPNAITRRGGALLKEVKQKEPNLVVDVREFMSSLPAVLYQQGLTLVPVTLEVSQSCLKISLYPEKRELDVSTRDSAMQNHICWKFSVGIMGK